MCRQRRGHAGVVHDQGGVRADRRPSVSSAIRASSHGVTAGPRCRPPRRRRSLARRRRGRRHRGVPLRRAPARTPDAAPQPEPEMRGRRSAAAPATSGGHGRRRDPRRTGRRTRARSACPTDDDRHAPRLEVLERGRHVEDRLRAGADTAIAVRPSSSRSDEMSKRCGPAPGPVQGAAMDAADAARREDADAGRDARRSSWPTPSSPPNRPRRARPPGSGARPSGRSRPGAVASASRASASSPTSSRPSRIATVAGTAPAVSRTAASDASATSRFCGYGKPWLISVDSSATTGRPSARAAATSGATTIRSATAGRDGHTGSLAARLPCRACRRADR